MTIAFKVILLAVLIQSPAWVLIGLNALAFQVKKELAFSAAYFAGLALAWWLHRSGYETVGLALMGATLLLTLYFWHAVATGRPL